MEVRLRQLEKHELILVTSGNSGKDIEVRLVHPPKQPSKSFAFGNPLNSTDSNLEQTEKHPASLVVFCSGGTTTLYSCEQSQKHAYISVTSAHSSSVNKISDSLRFGSPQFIILSGRLYVTSAPLPSHPTEDKELHPSKHRPIKLTFGKDGRETDFRAEQYTKQSYNVFAIGKSEKLIDVSEEQLLKQADKLSTASSGGREMDLSLPHA